MTKQAILGSWLICLVCFSLLQLNCDGERLWGYRFDAIPLTESIEISGTVIDRFREVPIQGATVRFADQEAITNSRGEYQLQFYLGTAFQRNKPVEIEVSANRYLRFTETVVLEPVDQQQDFELDYGAPIVENAVRHIFENGEVVVQALIRDYQEDVQRAELTLTYAAPNGERIHRQIPMMWISRADVNAHYYQGVGAISVSANGRSYTLLPTFRIFVQDAMAFTTEVAFTQPLDQNPPLFLPYRPTN